MARLATDCSQEMRPIREFLNKFQYNDSNSSFSALCLPLVSSTIYLSHTSYSVEYSLDKCGVGGYIQERALIFKICLDDRTVAYLLLLKAVSPLPRGTHTVIWQLWTCLGCSTNCVLLVCLESTRKER